MNLLNTSKADSQLSAVIPVPNIFELQEAYFKSKKFFIFCFLTILFFTIGCELVVPGWLNGVEPSEIEKS